MKTKVVWLGLGLILGIVISALALAGMGYYFYLEEQAENQARLAAIEANRTEASSTPDVSAYYDLSECPDVDSEALEGEWVGEKTLKSGYWQRWELNRGSDGNYRIRFTYRELDGTETVSNEGGLWSYSHCLYTVVTKAVDGRPSFRHEVYRVHEISPERMRYTHFRTGNTFEVRRAKNSYAPQQDG